LGDLIATPERGTFFGNRGCLHDSQGRIRRPWQLKRWIVCVLEFRGRKRQVMTPGRYTELFFLDEATALAAGHRPCAECRRARFEAFRGAWSTIVGSSFCPTADEMDNRLHAERVFPDRSKRLFTASLEDLPDGVFVRRQDWGEGAYLLYNGNLLAWSPGGYRQRRPRRRTARVQVLTPASTVKVIQAGYVPQVHASAGPPAPGRRGPVSAAPGDG
jgi:hypothetical protein